MIKDFTSSSFLVVGLARNCGKILHSEIQNINNAFTETASVDWLIIESDSDDNTLDVLDALSCDLNLKYLSLGVLRNEYPRRTERISVCRNYYLSEIKNGDYEHIDYVVVVDLDGVNSKLTSSSLRTCWNLDVEWDACFANQSAPYYDIEALRHDLWSPTNCSEQEQFLQNLGMDYFNSRYVSRFSKMIRIPVSYRPIKVQSAFGGLGIYKKHLFDTGEYVGIDEQGNELCEHVYFHTMYLNKANLYIVPSLINGGWNNHSIHKSFHRILLLYLATRFISINKLKKFKKFLNRYII